MVFGCTQATVHQLPHAELPAARTTVVLYSDTERAFEVPTLVLEMSALSRAPRAARRARAATPHRAPHNKTRKDNTHTACGTYTNGGARHPRARTPLTRRTVVVRNASRHGQIGSSWTPFARFDDEAARSMLHLVGMRAGHIRRPPLRLALCELRSGGLPLILAAE